LVDAFQRLFMPTSELAQLEKNCWNCWDMLLLIHCLYTYVWRQTLANPLLRSSPSTLYAPSHILDPLKLAIKNWKIKWDEIRCKLSREQLQGMGFETSADSYWTLTKLIVQRFDPTSPSNRSSGASTRDNASVASSVDVGQRPNKAQKMTNLQIGGMQLKVENDQMAGVVDTAPAFGGDGLANGGGMVNGGSGGVAAIDFMPIETDCDSQGAHLRKILRRVK
jgi:hypothetical protein